jgi:hypothetical protein
LESLQAPEESPGWHDWAWRAVVAVTSLWLLITVGVAFLREAKAVRVARVHLEEGHPHEAWALLGPFLADHPRHRQGLLLCGRATLRLDRRAEAKHCFETLRERSPELSEDLGADFRQVLSEQARALGCNVPGFGELLSWAADLGEPFAASVVAGASGVVEGCLTARSEEALWRLAGVLAERGGPAAMIESGFVPAIHRAMKQSRFRDAETMAYQATRMVPEQAATVEAALETERLKVRSTIETLQRLCSNLEADPRFLVGTSRCFPAEGATLFASARDGWGRSFVYTPLRDDGTGSCHRGFSLTSYGSDGVATGDDRQSPAAEIACTVISGRRSWQVPKRFWLSGSS